MKGQAVNVDWVVGLFIFITVLSTGIFLLTDDKARVVERDSGIREKASIVQETLEDETFVDARQAPLYIRGPTEVGKIPVDQDYVFPEDAYPESGIFQNIPSEIDEPGDHVRTVVDTGNRTYRMSFFFINTTNTTYSNSIDTGQWINNTYLSAKPGSDGLESLRINSQEVLNSTADLNSNDYSITEHEVYAETLGGKLKMFNGSRELLLENPGTVNLDLKNFTTLYWHNGSTTSNLRGTGTFRDSPTGGFTLATFEGSDYGITFLGDMDAKVSKNENHTVKVEITEPDRLRIYLHDTDYTKGRDRADFFTEGDIYFGTEEKLRGAFRDKINELEDLSESEFDEEFELGNWQYNITFGGLDRGNAIPFQRVIVKEKDSTILGRKGNYSEIDNRVAMWQ